MTIIFVTYDLKERKVGIRRPKQFLTGEQEDAFIEACAKEIRATGVPLAVVCSCYVPKEHAQYFWTESMPGISKRTLVKAARAMAAQAREFFKTKTEVCCVRCHST